MDAEKMQQQIDEIHTALLGGLDGKPGILTRLDRLENHNRYLGLAAAPGLTVFVAWLRDAIMGGAR